MDIREKFLTVRIVKDGNRLHRETVDPPLLEIFKNYLDESLSRNV